MTAAELQKLIDENAKLLVERREVFERVIVPAASITFRDGEGKVLEGAAIAEAKGGTFTAEVGLADKINQNRRIYPRREWAGVIDTAVNFQIPAGKLGGSTDHVGMLDGGNFKHKSVLWKNLSIDNEGRVSGDFVIPETQAGKDLKAWKDAGGAIGFSTYGYARAHEITDEERGVYGVAKEDYAVVIEDWELIAIDAVDNPSVRTAWMKGESVGRPASEAAGKPNPVAENAGGNGEEKQMDLETLKLKHPALYESIVNSAKAEGKTEGEAAVAPLKTAVESVVSALAEKAGVKLVKDVLPEDAQKQIDALVSEKTQAVADAKAEAQKTIDALTQQLKEANDKLATLESEKKTAEDAKAVLEAEKAEADRKAAVEAKLAECINGNKFPAAIKATVTKAAEAKDFTADKVEALVTEKTNELAAALAEATVTVSPVAALHGLLSQPKEDEAKGEGVEHGKPLSSVTSLAAMFN